MRSQETRTIPDLMRRTRPPGPLSDEPSPPRLGGRFVTLYRIGRGGMGEVFAAFDPELDRKVAVKVLHTGRASETGRERLLLEGRALARLNHPNVVKVYDVERAGEELVIAMELVDGPTLGDWLARGAKSWREVLEVFLEAGRGLAAAHAAGLIHRDFKPSNVMLTADREVRVLDFGIAHFGGEEAGEDGAARPGTPAYLAPERLDAEAAPPPDARSDQFSFCVALYEALCGEHPFVDAADAAGSLERLRQGRPRDARKARALPGWLVRALLRGLRPAPEERFATMTALLATLERGLKRRRRIWLVAAAGLFVTAGGVTGWVASRGVAEDPCGGAERQLAGVWDAARKEDARAAFAATGLTLAVETWPRVEAALDRYAADWATMKRDACEATYHRGEQSAQVLDLRMLCLDGRLAELRVAGELFAAADREVVAGAAESLSKLTAVSACGPSVELTTVTPLPQDPGVRERIGGLNAKIEEQSARLDLGRVVDRAAAEQAIEEAQALAYPPLAARGLMLRVRLLFEAGDAATAATTAEDALLAAIAGGDSLLEARVYTLLLKAKSFYQADQDAARRWQRFVEASIAALGNEHPEIEYEALIQLSQQAWMAGDYQEVEVRSRRALEIGERLWGPDDLRLANALNNLSIALSEMGHDEEGFVFLERAFAIREKHLGAENPRLVPILVNLAVHDASQGRYQEALDLALRSLHLLESFYPDGGTEAAIPAIVAGQVLIAMDRPAEAEGHLRRALASAIRNFGEQHGFVVQARVALSQALLLQERLGEAGDELDRAEQAAEESLPAAHPSRLEILITRGWWRLEQERPGLAVGPLERAFEMAGALPIEDYQTAPLWGLGEAQLGLGRPEIARGHLETALQQLLPGTEPSLRARIRFALARALPANDKERARSLAAAALKDLAGRSAWSQRLRREIVAWQRER